MAWTLFEELVKAGTVFLAGFLLKGVWRAAMETKRCMIPGCYGTGSQQGLCLKCYSRAKAKVAAGETTWEKLAERGLCETKKDPFDDAYSRAMEGE